LNVREKLKCANIVSVKIDFFFSQIMQFSMFIIRVGRKKIIDRRRFQI